MNFKNFCWMKVTLMVPAGWMKQVWKTFITSWSLMSIKWMESLLIQPSEWAKTLKAVTGASKNLYNMVIYENLACLAQVHTVPTASGIVASSYLQIHTVVAFETTESCGFCCKGCCDFYCVHQMLLEMMSEPCAACKCVCWVSSLCRP